MFIKADRFILKTMEVHFHLINAALSLKSNSTCLTGNSTNFFGNLNRLTKLAPLLFSPRELNK